MGGSPRRRRGLHPVPEMIRIREWSLSIRHDNTQQFVSLFPHLRHRNMRLIPQYSGTSERDWVFTTKQPASYEVGNSSPDYFPKQQNAQLSVIKSNIKPTDTISSNWGPDITLMDIITNNCQSNTGSMDSTTNRRRPPETKQHASIDSWTVEKFP